MKNILFITYDFPYPVNSGGKNRAYHMLKYSKGDFNKYLYSFVRAGFDRTNISYMDEIGVETVGTYLRRKVSDPKNVFGVVSGGSIFKSLYYSQDVASDLLKIVHDKKIDIIHFESYYTAFYISDVFKTLGVKQIYGSENIEYKLYEDYAKSKGILKRIFNLQVNKIKKEEISMYKNSDATLAVTSDEVKYIQKYNEKTYEIPNGIDIHEFKFEKPEKEGGNNLLFVGNFMYFPNVVAIEEFYKDIFKKLETPSTLTVIGKRVGSLSFIADPNVKAIEFIDDIKDAYSNADILISPIKIGGGTNFKVLEAMAAGVPVVAYKDRLDALSAEDEKHVLVADNEDDFKKKIERLLTDSELRVRIATEARSFVEEKYSWEKIGAALAKVWCSL